MVTATPEKDAEKFEAWKYGENNMFGAILEIANSIFFGASYIYISYPHNQIQKLSPCHDEERVGGSRTAVLNGEDQLTWKPLCSWGFLLEDYYGKELCDSWGDNDRLVGITWYNYGSLSKFK